MASHQQLIIKSILSSNMYIGNREVLNLQEIAAVPFSTENLDNLKEVLKKGEYEKINSFEPVKDLLGEELCVIKFRSEKQKLHYAIYYTSLELLGSPEVVEIIPAVVPATK